LEPKLNSAIPGDERDTSTPASMGDSLQQVLLGGVLDTSKRQQLQTWLKGNTTGKERISAGVPEGMIVGDKTGTCDYGTTNDIGIIWPEKGSPIIVAIYFTQKEKNASPRSDVIALVTKALMDSLP
jgi:beta-lactamase class A